MYKRQVTYSSTNAPNGVDLIWVFRDEIDVLLTTTNPMNYCNKENWMKHVGSTEDMQASSLCEGILFLLARILAYNIWVYDMYYRSTLICRSDL